MRKGITIIIAAALALSIAPAVTGCSMIEGVIEQQTGGDVDLGGKSIPKDFPADVPLAEGDVVYGAGIKSSDGQAWNVTIKVSGADAFDAITTQLEDAGFTANGGVGGSTADGGTGTFTSDKYGVAVIVSKDADNGFVANYTVTTVNTSN